jgi:hypothetical protein
VDDVGEAGDVSITLLDDAEGEDREIHADNAATDRLSLALTGASGSVARVALGKEEADTGRVHDTLLHRETLLVVSTGDAEDVALELIADGVTRNLSAHLPRKRVSILSVGLLSTSRAVAGKRVSTYALLHEDTELALILNIDELLAAIGRVADVQL